MDKPVYTIDVIDSEFHIFEDGELILICEFRSNAVLIANILSYDCEHLAYRDEFGE